MSASRQWRECLDRPWSLRFSNEIRAIRKAYSTRSRFAGLPALARMFDLVTHPKFAENQWIYFGHGKSLGEGKTAMVMARGRYEGGSLSNVQDL
jgi:hypothetical protein